MYGLTEWQFWLGTMWFLVAIFVSFYIPGSVILRKASLPNLTHGLLSFCLGLILWGFQGYILGYLNLRFLSYVYLAFFAAIWFHSFGYYRERLTNCLKEAGQVPLVAWSIIGLGSLIQLAQVWTTGLKFGGNIGLFRINAYDGVLHLAFIQALVKQVPAVQPGAVGLPLNHYHYWSDLIAADLHRVWQLPIIHLFFQWMPVVLAIGTGLVLFQLIKTWKGTTSTAVWCLLLLYLASDMAYIFTLWFHGNWGSKVAAIDNGAMQFLNIPHGYAKFVFLTALMPLTFWLKKRSLLWGLITASMMASLFGLKVYFGIFAAIGLSLVVTSYGLIAIKELWHGSASPWQLIKKHLWLLAPYTLLALAAAAIYFPSNSDSGGLFWSPLEWPKLFLGQDHINWQKWWLLRQVYQAAESRKGLIALDSLAIGICLVSVFGTRLLGLIPNPTWYRRLGWQLLVFFVPTSLICIFLGLYTLQESGLFNVFNFFAVAAIPLAILTGLSLDSLWHRKNILFKIMPLIVLTLGLPRIFLTTQEAVSYTAEPRFEQKITPDQQAAFEYLRSKTHPDALIQSHPANEFDRRTPYVAFFSNRPTYLTGISMLESHNQPIADRQSQLKKIFSSSSSLLLKSELQAQKIEYLYLEKKPDQQFPFVVPDERLPAVFENDQTLILKVN